MEGNSFFLEGFQNHKKEKKENKTKQIENKIFHISEISSCFLSNAFTYQKH